MGGGNSKNSQPVSDQLSYVTSNSSQKINSRNRNENYNYLYISDNIEASQKKDKNQLESIQYTEENKNNYYNQQNSPVSIRSCIGICGLKNIGNTCFMNATLQCLFNCPMFSDIFISNTWKKDINRKQNGIAEQFAQLIQKIRQKNNKGPENPSQLKQAISNKTAQFQGYQQQDAQEFLVNLLEGINEDLNRGQMVKYVELKADLKSKKLHEISQEWYAYYKSRDHSYVTDFFSGQLLNTVTCRSCDTESIAFDNFLDISLSFPRGLRMSSDISLKKLFEWYLSEENLDDLFYCIKCKAHRKSKRKLSLYKIPDILVIHLKRFLFTKTKKQKINDNIVFPIKNFDLTEFLDISKDQSVKDPIYDLFGIVLHTGNLNMGHYLAQCKNMFDRRWYEYNDTYVEEIDIKKSGHDSKGSQEPYILFYAKQSLIQNQNYHKYQSK